MIIPSTMGDPTQSLPETYLNPRTLPLSMKGMVIGAGAAGLVTSRLLAEHGLGVELYERNPDVYTHFTGELTGKPALEFFDGDAIDNRLTNARIVSLDSGREIDVSTNLSLLSADRLKLSLLEQAEAAGVKTHFGSPVREVRKRSNALLPGSRVAKGLQGGDIAVVVGEDRRRCDLVVGCDGGNSMVARDHFPDPGLKLLKAIRFKLRGAHGLDVTTAYFFIGKDVGLGYLWCYPRTDRDLNVGIGSIDKGPLTPLLEKFISGRFNGLGKRKIGGGHELRIIARGGDSIPYTGLRRSIAIRDMALVGNSAGQVSSLLGGGLEASFQGARTLVDSIHGDYEFDPDQYVRSYLETYPRIQRSARLIAPLLAVNASGNLFSHMERFMEFIGGENIKQVVADGTVKRSISKMILRHPLQALQIIRDHRRGRRILRTLHSSFDPSLSKESDRS
jgi:flavin-dependent dehydrogenase